MIQNNHTNTTCIHGHRVSSLVCFTVAASASKAFMFWLPSQNCCWRLGSWQLVQNIKLSHEIFKVASLVIITKQNGSTISGHKWQTTNTAKGYTHLSFFRFSNGSKEQQIKINTKQSPNSVQLNSTLHTDLITLFWKNLMKFQSHETISFYTHTIWVSQILLVQNTPLKNFF